MPLWLGRALLLGVALLAVLGLGGCGADTAAAKDSLGTSLTALQERDVQEAQKYFQAVWFDPEDYGVSVETFTDLYFEDFAYSLGKATVNNDGSVDVEATVSTRDMATVLKDLQGASDAVFAASGGAAIRVGDADQYFYDSYKKSPWGSEDTTFTVTMEQDDDGTWDVRDKGLLGAVLLHGYDPRQLGDW